MSLCRRTWTHAARHSSNLCMAPPPPRPGPPGFTMLRWMWMDLNKWYGMQWNGPCACMDGAGTCTWRHAQNKFKFKYKFARDLPCGNHKSAANDWIMVWIESEPLGNWAHSPFTTDYKFRLGARRSAINSKFISAPTRTQTHTHTHLGSLDLAMTFAFWQDYSLLYFYIADFTSWLANLLSSSTRPLKSRS